MCLFFLLDFSVHSCPLTPVVSKASSGAMEVLDVFGTDDLQSLLKVKETNEAQTTA